uniref:GG11616 n=1 Tax=Drosophila erecta TaxID=7220 RepID=B3P5P9_DROER
MDRFAFKIDAALKANLCKICRLCGIDNPGKVQILLPNEEVTIDLDEPSMSQKIYELVGFTVSVDDKMPQTMCSQCVDKINDFYEFREMCYATNKQTRNLLGLKQIEPARLIDLKPVVKEERQVSGAVGKRGRKRKGDESWPKNNLNVKPQVKKEPLVWHKKQKLQPSQITSLVSKREPQIKDEPADPESSLKGPPKKGGRKSICSVCGEKFLSKELADDHKSLVHVPSIPRYMCNACNQTHHNHSDIRAHQLWHKLSKTPYKCPVCEASVANAYAFTRHLREHTPPTPVQLLVLDRECPLCKKTFVTNFFYNTHRCAIRKRKCGGCSRALNTEAAYMRHAPTCPKIYLNHSKHIMPQVVTNEAHMLIKNEIEEELLGLPPATAVPPDFVIDEGMQPVVVLERLSSPLLRASSGPNQLGVSKGKNSDRVSAKNYLKRVDQLLKNTMNTLVSIKHEPEVHINDTGPAAGQAESDPEPEQDEEHPSFGDDFQAANDDSEEECQLETGSDKFSPNASDNIPSVSVKQEPEYEGYEKQAWVKQEPLKLKLKITKNHGKLNSSLIDDIDEAGPAFGRSSKKKKKRKHKEREKEAPTEIENCRTESQNQPAIRIKQEPVDYAPEATVMTTIPMTQFDSSLNENERSEDVDEAMAQNQEDIKPNRMELDRLMQISHVASGVDMAEEAMSLERAEEACPKEPQTRDGLQNPTEKVSSVKSTARKSTGGAERKTYSPPRTTTVPQIVAVVSGESAFNMISIKPEPRNRGYGDEEPDEQRETTEEINHNDKMEEEDAYIGSLDLCNVSVKQERELDICEIDALHSNGLEKSDEDDDDGNDDSASSADEAEEAMEQDEEERIYREIELPPLELQNESDMPSTRKDAESERMDTEVSTALPAGETHPQTSDVLVNSPPHNDQSESLEKPDTAAGSADSLTIEPLDAPKDTETLALPPCETANIDSNYACDEEQQNVLNHELSEQQLAALEDRQLLVHDEQPSWLEVIPPARPIEETENRINEQQQDMEQGEERPPRFQANDDSNINEIAENNNNANIERELQDDALGA